MTPTRIAAAAHEVIARRDAARPVPRLPPDLRPAVPEEGYAIQAEALRLRRAAGAALAGWKIGCTTAVMQEIMGIDAPAYGTVLAGNVRSSPARVSRDATTGPLAECEIAVEIARDVPARTGGHDRESVAPHVAACMAAIELVEFRFPERERMTVAEFIADDFFQRGVVLGPRIAAWRDIDLAAVRGSTAIDGQVRGEGRGAEVMGHPLTALAWLADRLAEAGTPLRTGQIVLTGTLPPAIPVAPGETALCAVEHLGEVELAIV